MKGYYYKIRMEFLRPILTKTELICQQPDMTRPTGVIVVNSPGVGWWMWWLGVGWGGDEGGGGVGWGWGWGWGGVGWGWGWGWGGVGMRVGVGWGGDEGGGGVGWGWGWGWGGVGWGWGWGWVVGGWRYEDMVTSPQTACTRLLHVRSGGRWFHNPRKLLCSRSWISVDLQRSSCGQYEFVTDMND